jgi:hypothetical protein
VVGAAADAPGLYQACEHRSVLERGASKLVRQPNGGDSTRVRAVIMVARSGATIMVARSGATAAAASGWPPAALGPLSSPLPSPGSATCRPAGQPATGAAAVVRPAQRRPRQAARTESRSEHGHRQATRTT